ncbi:hypothetical protein PSR1_04139 [Anaeromyxobacter sp. PSR-1]|nr:hypothetical protein PSR1_04139 [Anaeromyxobacter sp. PSR-1]
MAVGFEAANGSLPVASQYRMVPSENTSLRASASWPSTISGAMWCGEPTSAPVMVMRSSEARIRAMPKSASFTEGGSSSWTSTFSGLRSRWMTPAACACASASASVRPTSMPSSG